MAALEQLLPRLWKPTHGTSCSICLIYYITASTCMQPHWIYEQRAGYKPQPQPLQEPQSAQRADPRDVRHPKAAPPTSRPTCRHRTGSSCFPKYSFEHTAACRRSRVVFESNVDKRSSSSRQVNATTSNPKTPP